MAFPAEGWPPRQPTGRRNIRFYASGTATTLFSDNAFLFIDGTGANPYTPLPVVPPGSTTPVALNGTPYGTGRPPEDAAGSGNTPAPKATIYSTVIRILNDSGSNTLSISFDGTNVHGQIKPNEALIYWNRCESGIAVKSTAACAFRIEAW